MYKALIGNIRKAKDLGREEALKEVNVLFAKPTY